MKVIDPAISVGARVHARYCEGDYCRDPEDEVRVYPLRFAARIILCGPLLEAQKTLSKAARQKTGMSQALADKDLDKAQPYSPLRSAFDATAIAVPVSGLAAKAKQDKRNDVRRRFSRLNGLTIAARTATT
jgi:hypothetical protein